MLTLHLFKAPDLATIVKDAQAANSARGVQLIGDADPAAADGPDERGTGAALTAGAAEHAAAGRDDLRRALLHLSRPGRPRRARRGQRRDQGAVVRRLAARAGPSRLRRQGDPARHDRSDRRPDVHRRDGADGDEPGRLGRGRGVVSADQLRQLGLVRHARRRRAGARRDRRSEDAVDVRGARSLASGRARAAEHLERHRQPQRAGCGRRVELRGLVHRARRRSPACGSRSSFPNR